MKTLFRKQYLIIFNLTFMVLLACTTLSQARFLPIKHVILISFDGLRPDAVTNLGPYKAPAFYQLIKEGASTLNARSDYDYTITIPNHTSMITGYPVMGTNGHHVIDNILVNKKVHEYAGRHVYSVFDVLHQFKRKSAMLASKLKFNIYARSYPIDIVSLTDQDDFKTLLAFKNLVHEGLPDFVFVHFAGTDRVGHKHGWDVKASSSYMQEIQVLDGYLGRMMKMVLSELALKNSTVMIVTSDHGGEALSHSDKKNPHNYTIPFMIWGKPVAKGVDLYTINNDRRKNPFDKRIGYNKSQQPIRNSDAANLALSLLGLPAVEGSTIGNHKPLRINEGH